MWIPIVAALVTMPVMIFLWTLDLDQRDLFLVSLPFALGYVGASLRQARKM